MKSLESCAIGTFAHAFTPGMCETAVSRLLISWIFLQDLSRAVSRFSMCPVAGNHRRYFFDPIRERNHIVIARPTKGVGVLIPQVCVLISISSSWSGLLYDELEQRIPIFWSQLNTLSR